MKPLTCAREMPPAPIRATRMGAVHLGCHGSESFQFGGGESTRGVEMHHQGGQIIRSCRELRHVASMLVDAAPDTRDDDAQEIAKSCRESSRRSACFPDDKHPACTSTRRTGATLAEFLYADPRLQLDWLQSLSGVDYVADGKMCVRVRPLELRPPAQSSR